ncbi:MAG: phosphoserine phosphatase SerB [Nitrosomonas sp.]|nr:phosphoserine phosphatase SerB [Nitrosomonas sp.]MBK7364085.1 phosphoserine phosphatase SerB [Nitrosomonas sp.]
MNLIIQGLDIQNHDLRHIAKLAQASHIERITGEAFRLVNATEHSEIPNYCADAQLDFAYVTPNKKLSEFGLVVMDMDSTLIAIESIDEIAALCNVKQQVAEITTSTMRGEIDFSESLIRRTALLKGLPEDLLQQVYDQKVKLSLGADKMLHKMKLAGLRTMVISGGFTFFTDRIKAKLGLDFSFANQLEITDGKLTGSVAGEIIGAKGKADILKNIRDQLHLNKEQVIAIGDGANDLPMLTEAGTSIAFHGKPILQGKTTFSINYVGLDAVINFFEQASPY